MDIWAVVTAIHLLAMAFFIGGQIVLVASVSILKGTDQMIPFARRFALGSLIAVVIAILTGTELASHFDLWSSPALHAKLGLLVVVTGLIVWHMQPSGKERHWLHPLIGVLSLTIFVLGVSLGH
jgi:putative copper export protein